MQREVRKYLFDVQEASNLLHSFVAGKDLTAYANDALLRSAVERQLMIIGEAVVHLARVDQSVAEQIRDFRRIISFRNRLIHLYDNLDLEIVWDVIINDVPDLQEDVKRLLEAD